MANARRCEFERADFHPAIYGCVVKRSSGNVNSHDHIDLSGLVSRNRGTATFRGFSARLGQASGRAPARNATGVSPGGSVAWHWSALFSGL